MLKRALLAIGGTTDDNEPSSQLDWDGIDLIYKLGKSLREKGYTPRLVFHTTHRAARDSAHILAGILGSESVLLDQRLDDAASIECPRQGENTLRDVFRSPEKTSEFLSSVTPIHSTDETILIVRCGGWGGTFGMSDCGPPWWPASTTFSFDFERQCLEFVDSYANSI